MCERWLAKGTSRGKRGGSMGQLLGDPLAHPGISTAPASLLG